MRRRVSHHKRSRVPRALVAVPGLLALIEGDLPSGRYGARSLAGTAA